MNLHIPVKHALTARISIKADRCTEYPGAMAGGVLKVSLGQGYMPKLAKAARCRLPSRATTYFDQRHNKLTKLANYKKSKEGKLVS